MFLCSVWTSVSNSFRTAKYVFLRMKDILVLPVQKSKWKISCWTIFLLFLMPAQAAVPLHFPCFFFFKFYISFECPSTQQPYIPLVISKYVSELSWANYFVSKLVVYILYLFNLQASRQESFSTFPIVYLLMPWILLNLSTLLNTQCIQCTCVQSTD